MKCEHCGVSDENEQLYDVIFEGKIVRMCRKCAELDGLPIVKKTDSFSDPTAERRQTVYERMVHISGVNRDVSNPEKNKVDREMLKKREMTLRDVVERNMKTKPVESPVMKKEGVVNNYHWIIMRARRARKFSHEQLAEMINESPIVIAKIERGQLPDDSVILKKLEDALKIKLFLGEDNGEYFTSSSDEEIIKVPRDKPIVFDSKVIENLKIGDLKELDEEPVSDDEESEIKDKISYWKKIKSKLFKPKEKEIEETEIEEVQEVEVQPEEKPKEKKSYRERQQQSSGMSKRDLSSKEINELIFGKKEDKKK